MMKLFQEQTLEFHSKQGAVPWQKESVPVLELREGPWWAFLQERLFRCASSKIATRYVRNYTLERYLEICCADDVNEYVSHVSVFNKALTETEMAELTKPTCSHNFPGGGCAVRRRVCTLCGNDKW